MNNPFQRIVILGGHGKVALLAVPRLVQAGFAVDAVIRKPEQQADVEQTGARAALLDMERARVADFAERFAGAHAVVFSAGAGGGSPARTRAVDFEAATRSMLAAEVAGVLRYVMVSYANATHHHEKLDYTDPFYPYARAKHDADAYLRTTSLNYTILGPGLLTLEQASGRVQLADANGRVAGDWSKKREITSRDNVAAVIAHVITHDAAQRQTVNFYDGDTPIATAIPAD